jgi:hypothetical protein
VLIELEVECGEKNWGGEMNRSGKQFNSLFIDRGSDYRGHVTAMRDDSFKLMEIYFNFEISVVNLLS